jgi:GNAT superfamily N-acetyltransferase
VTSHIARAAAAPALTVRRYHEPDRAAVCRIAADTALFGEPVEAFLDDRRLFWEAAFSYYLDYEPDHAWVAVSGAEVAGFLLGCVDTTLHDQVLLRRIIPAVAWQALRGRYHVGRRTLGYAFAAGFAALRHEYPHVDLSLYPAHLHINLDARFRGHGAGRGLMEAYLDQLHILGVAGVHLRTTNMNRAAVKLYEGTGFTLLDARPTRVWSGVVQEPVENRCYGQRLVGRARNEA